MRDPYLRLLGEKVRAARAARNLSQEKLADASGIHRTYLSSLERGMRNASILTLARVARALGVSVAVLLPPTNKTIKTPKKLH